MGRRAPGGENFFTSGDDEVTNVKGTLHFDDQYEQFYIRYFVPGTIDSNYRGYIITELFPDFLFTEGMTVEFSGRFYETDAYPDILIRLGGEQIAVLDLDFLAVP